ncbi:hypothetical protein A8U91_02238 [Halomonas elongata]|uniref:Uncharacterized protein n=1 Tax=Halomonas elongata TaxID=2746 RepID=A0A1B8P6L4_HALEL|nr:hypothetical protein A8U91_02238 [Halomonas elongata]
MTPDITTVSPERALDDHEALFALLERWVARGWLRSLDRAFADFLRREVSEASPRCCWPRHSPVTSSGAGMSASTSPSPWKRRTSPSRCPPRAIAWRNRRRCPAR